MKQSRGAIAGLSFLLIPFLNACMASALRTSHGGRLGEEDRHLAVQSHSVQQKQQHTDVPIVHVVYASSLNSTGAGDIGLMASMLFLSRNMEHPGKAVIHLIVPQRDMALAQQLVKCFEKQWVTVSDAHMSAVSPHPTVSLHTFKPLPSIIQIDHNAHNDRLRGVDMTFARFFLPEYLSNVSRVIYMDTDTIVQGDVRRLYSQKLRGNSGAVGGGYYNMSLAKNYVDMVEAVPEHMRQDLLLSAGIFVADLDRWRSENMTSALEETSKFVRTKSGSLDDQLVLNIVWRDHGVDLLDVLWNWEGLGWDDQCYDVSAESGSILHWSGPHKPWAFESCPPFDRYKPHTSCGL